MDTRLTGPVVIAGADGHVGRHLCARLAALPNEVRTGDGCERAGAVVVLTGSLRPLAGGTYEDTNVEPVRAVVAAAREARVPRIVYLSYVGADPASDNEYLRAKGLAERAVGDAVVLRTTYIFGPRHDPGLTVEELAACGAVPLVGAQRLAPVYVEDVVDALVRAALDPEVPTGTYELGGAETMSLATFVRALGGRCGAERRVAFASSHHVRGLTPALVGVLLRDSVARPPLARDALGLPPATPLESVWPGTSAAA